MLMAVSSMSIRSFSLPLANSIAMAIAAISMSIVAMKAVHVKGDMTTIGMVGVDTVAIPGFGVPLAIATIASIAIAAIVMSIVAMKMVLIPGNMATIGVVGVQAMAIAGLGLPLANAITMAVAIAKAIVLAGESLNSPVDRAIATIGMMCYGPIAGFSRNKREGGKEEKEGCHGQAKLSTTLDPH